MDRLLIETFGDLNELVHALFVGFEEIVYLEGPELIVPEWLPRHFLRSIRQNGILDHFLGGRCNRTTDPFFEVLDFGQPRNNFQELVTAERFVIVVVEINFLEINGNKCAINILRRQVLINDLPLFRAVHEIEPTNHGVVLGIRNLVIELIFQGPIVFPEYSQSCG